MRHSGARSKITEGKLISTNQKAKNRKRAKRKKREKRKKASNKPVSNTKQVPTSLNTYISYHSSMSQRFWDTYRTCTDWRMQHQIAYWKSYAMALEKENDCLIKTIQENGLQPNIRQMMTFSDLPQQSRTLQHKVPYQEFSSSEEDVSESEDDGAQYEMSEEMKEFFRQSIKHKLELRKSREQKTEDINQELDDKQKAADLRKQQMKLLYGTDAEKISGMETSVQLSYEHNCDSDNPKYWPNLPLNLSNY